MSVIGKIPFRVMAVTFIMVLLMRKAILIHAFNTILIRSLNFTFQEKFLYTMNQ